MAESDFNTPGYDDIPTPQPAAPGAGASRYEEAEDGFLSKGAHEFDMSKNAGHDDEDEGPSETRESFSALRDSISQGRELKAREKEHSALVEHIEAGKEELTDRENILMNYQAIAGEQDAILAQKSQERQAAAQELSDVQARTKETEQALDRMRSYHSQQLKPLEKTLGQAKAAADQAKNDERSRKSELNSVESELRKAADEDIEIVQEKQRLILTAYNEAKARTESAKDVLKQADKSYNATKKQFDGEEAPLRKEIKQLKDRAKELKDMMASLDETISRVQDRRQYVENVYRNPDETAELRASIASDEASEKQMSAENEELRAQFEETKGRARKAKFMVIGIIAAIIVVIVLVIVLMPKGGNTSATTAPAANTSAQVTATDTSVEV